MQDSAIQVGGIVELSETSNLRGHPWKLRKDKCNLSNTDISRYSRQLILTELGPSGQEKLADAHVLIVGCGGLGCPAAVYLAAAGVTHITLVDDDVVELCNLHRQVMHSEDTIGLPKVESLAQKLRSINSTVQIDIQNIRLKNSNVCDLVSRHNIVLDCTDNVTTRYLLNDACVVCGSIPLVSGSSLRLEGQLTVYVSKHICGMGGNQSKLRQYDEDRVPCYRCIHPIPPPTVTVQRCAEVGVMGVVPGIIGTMEAAEAIKIITGIGDSIAGRLFLIDMTKNNMRSVELRRARADCLACSPTSTLTPKTIESINYAEFCGLLFNTMVDSTYIQLHESQISVKELKQLRDNNTPHLLIDVRPAVEVAICRLKDCLYVPLSELYRESNLAIISDLIRSRHSCHPDCLYQVILISHRGSKSQETAEQMSKALESVLSHENFKSSNNLADMDTDTFTQCPVRVRDVAGGLDSWSKEIDPEFPIY